MQATQAVHPAQGKNALFQPSPTASQGSDSFKAILASEIAAVPADAPGKTDPKAPGIAKTGPRALKDIPDISPPQAAPVLAANTVDVIPAKALPKVDAKKEQKQDTPVEPTASLQPQIPLAAPPIDAAMVGNTAATGAAPKKAPAAVPAENIPANAAPKKAPAAVPAENIPADAAPKKAPAAVPAENIPADAAPKKAPAAVPAENIPADAASGKAPLPGKVFQALPYGAAQKETAKPADIALTGNILPPKSVKPSSSLTMAEKPVLPETHKIQENQTALQAVSISQPADMKPVPKVTVDTPVANPSWEGEIGRKIVWMTNSDHHVAELHLNPPNLGPMEVRLSVHQDQAAVQFVSHHPEVRAALESALPKLREMMMDNGIALGNATVDSGSSGQSGFSRQDRPSQRSVFPVDSPLRVSRLTGKVDIFA